MRVFLRELDSSHINEIKSDLTILRRGVPFEVVFKTRKWKQACNEEMKLTLTVNKLRIEITPGSESAIEGWTCIRTLDKEEGAVVLKVESQSDVCIGNYKLEAIYQNEVVTTLRFFMLFNPWNQNDDTYMENDADRNEFVYNETTQIYFGNHKCVRPNFWYLCQFDSATIETCLILLKKMPASDLKSAIKVGRNLTALVNSNDNDNGILVGNWSGNYDGGTKPTSWTGSRDILRRYIKTGKPVTFGQCWVFAAVLCTVNRFLGIPSRIITTFGSFHDADASLDWEVYYNSDGSHSDKSNDSCWNFHCWVDAWMQRPDIGSKHSGWQIVDGTPQEESGKLYRMGPTSLYAVKQGLVDLPYDTGFVFSEVNAAKCHYVCKDGSKPELILVEKDKVGLKIVSKQVGYYDKHQDLTRDYKYDPESPDGIAVYKRVLPFTPRAKIDTKPDESDTVSTIDLSIEAKDKVNATHNYRAYLKFKNSRNEDGKIVITSNMTSEKKTIAKLFSEVIPVKQEYTRQLDIPFKEHMNKMINQSIFIITKVEFFGLSGALRKTDICKTIVESYRIKVLTVPGKIEIGLECSIQVEIINKSNSLIRNQNIYLDSRCIRKKVKNVVEETSESNVPITMKFVPTRTGPFYFSVYMENSVFVVARGIGWINVQ